MTKKYLFLIPISLFILIVVVFNFIFSSSILDITNIPNLGKAVLSLTFGGARYYKLDSNSYLIRDDEDSLQTLIDHLESTGITQTDQMGAGYFFVDSDGNKYITTTNPKETLRVFKLLKFTKE